LRVTCRRKKKLFTLSWTKIPWNFCWKNLIYRRPFTLRSDQEECTPELLRRKLLGQRYSSTTGESLFCILPKITLKHRPFFNEINGTPRLHFILHLEQPAVTQCTIFEKFFFADFLPSARYFCSSTQHTLCAMMSAVQ
jgi:hypothetical protein